MSPSESAPIVSAFRSRLRYLLVGAAMVAIAYFGLSSQSPIEPKGAFAESLRVEIKSAMETAGISGPEINCEMHGNIHFGVTCNVKPYGLADATLRLRAEGWHPTESPPLVATTEHAAFIKQKIRLSLDASPSKRQWAVSASAAK